MFKSITFKFFFILLGILIIASGTSSYWISGLVEDAQIDRAKNVIANDIRVHTLRLLSPQSFVFGSQEASSEKLTFFLNTIQTSEIIRIKVWDMDSRVIFSDEKEIIGKTFPSNKTLIDSFKGNIEVEIKKQTERENVGESQYGQLLEVYIPIYFEGNSNLAGVVEVYFNMDKVNELLSEVKVFIFIAIVSTAISAFIAIWFLFIFLIRKKLYLMVNAAREFATGNLRTRVDIKGHDEIGELASAFNYMANRLEETYESLEQKIQERTKELDADNRIMIGRELKMIELKKEVERLEKLVKNNRDENN